MNIEQKIPFPDRASLISLEDLSRYFKNPDMEILNIAAISAQQFIKDMDTILEFSKNTTDRLGKFESISIPWSSNKSKNDFKLLSMFKRLISNESHTENNVEINSWCFSDFDYSQKFQVGSFYMMRPVSVTYNSTLQDYEFSHQIISEFRIEKANGDVKKLEITDSVKNGITKREKHIDGKRIYNQNYNLEIRNHYLNRGLMKYFLIHQIFCLNDLDVSPPQNTYGIPEEYINRPVYKSPVTHNGNLVDMNRRCHLTDRHRINFLSADLIHAADGYTQFYPNRHNTCRYQP